MPRGKAKGTTNSLDSQLQSLVTEFASRLAQVVRGHVAGELARGIDRLRAGLVGGAPSAGVIRPAPAAPAVFNRVCRVPGCGNSAGPRFDYFCKEHRGMPAAEKAAVKAKTPAKKAAPAPRTKAVKAAPARTAAALVTCSTPGCTGNWYRPGGKEKRLCYKHYLEAGGKPPKGWTGPHK